MKQKLIIRTGIFILLTCLQYGCDTNKHKHQAYQDMKDFVLDEYNRGGIYFLFFETHSKNEIAYINATDLQYVLRKKLKINSKNIDSFFKNLMLGKIILSCEDLGNCFTLSPVIIDEYKRKSLDEFVNMYATHNEKYKEYTINPSLSFDEKLSIAYYFYLNNIYTGVGSYSGYFFSRKEYLRGIPIEDDFDLIEIEE
jgi:hypothetical protein